MPDLQYRLWHFGGLWHWEVLAERGLRLGHGATLTRVGATAEAMAYGMHPARTVEIETIELARSAERLEIAHRACDEAEQTWQVASRQVSNLVWLRDRGETLISGARVAVAEARQLLTSIRA